jgi:Ni/Co efflux regulator RcnB
MIKHIRTLGAAAAALAASAVLVSASTPALAQQFPDQSEELEGAPRLFSGQDYDRDRDWDRERDSDRRPDYQHAQRNCSREANREAWDRNYYSAQYDNGPRLEYDRNGWQLRGRMRLHDRRGYSHVNTVCDLRRNGEVTDFDFLR